MEQQQYGHSRPRAKSGFSLRSNKSDSSGNSKPKVDIVETEVDKRRWHMKEGTKANPNTAIDEAQPGVFVLDLSFHIQF